MDVLNITTQDIMRPENLRRVVLESIPLHTMFQDEKTRKTIILKMKEDELKDFAKFLKIEVGGRHVNSLLRAKFTKSRIKLAVEFFGEKLPEEKIIVRKIENVKPEEGMFPHQ